jgi:hypothetical protein
MAQLAEVQFPALWDAINGKSGPETLCTSRGTVLQSCRRCSPLSCFISSVMIRQQELQPSLARKHLIGAFNWQPTHMDPHVGSLFPLEPSRHTRLVVLSRSQQSEVETVLQTSNCVLEPRWPQDSTRGYHLRRLTSKQTLPAT